MRATDRKNDLLNYWRVIHPDTDWPFKPEHYFARPERQWRFDWANIELKLAIEVEGVVYRKGKKGRHQTPVGYEGDCEKYNAAQRLGWRVLRYSPAMIKRDPVGVIEEILDVAALCREEQMR